MTVHQGALEVCPATQLCCGSTGRVISGASGESAEILSRRQDAQASERIGCHEARNLDVVPSLTRACGSDVSKRCRRYLGLALDLLPWSVFVGLTAWVLWAAFIYTPSNLD